MELNLKGRTALITGGSHGIGLAIKLALEKEGVIVTSWSRSEGFDLTEGIPEVPDADIIINNVGGGGTWAEWDWDDVMEKNYGVMKDITLEWLSNYPSRRWGRVITVASIYGKEKGSNAGFTAAKAAQIAFMKSMAGVTKGITFNTICPGHIQVGKQFFDKPDIIGQPEDVANIVTFLCSEKARHINGACITVDGGESSSF